MVSEKFSEIITVIPWCQNDSYFEASISKTTSYKSSLESKTFDHECQTVGKFTLSASVEFSHNSDGNPKYSIIKWQTIVKNLFYRYPLNSPIIFILKTSISNDCEIYFTTIHKIIFRYQPKHFNLHMSDDWENHFIFIH